MLCRSLCGFLLFALTQLTWASWHLSYNGMSCQLSQSVTIFNGSEKQRLKIQFSVNDEDGITFSASTHPNKPLEALFIADNEILLEDDHRFRLQHSDARELFIMLRDFASGRKRPINIDAINSNNDDLTGSFNADDLLIPFKRSKPCFNALTSAIQRL